MSFAQHEMRVVLATVFSRATLALAPTATARPVIRGITVSPADGLPLVLTRRG